MAKTISDLPLEWLDGEFCPPKEIRALFSVEDYPPESAMLIGTEGALLLPHGSMPKLLPGEKSKDYPGERHLIRAGETETTAIGRPKAQNR